MTRTSAGGRVVAGVGALALALVPAAPALAAGRITSPSSGTTVESHRGVEVTALVEGGSAQTELRLRDPLGVPSTVAVAPPSLQDRTLSHVFDTSCPDLGGGCTSGSPARNGTWRVELAGGAEDVRELVVRVPPRPPTGVEGAATGPREVVLTWRRGSEPDLTGYVVVDGEGRQVSDVGLGACETPTCRHVVAYDEPGPSTQVLAVRARRSSCPECTAALTSASSEPVRVERPAGPALPGEPAPAPSGAPGAPGAPAPGSPTPAPTASASPGAGPSAPASPGAGPSSGTGTASGRGLGFGRSGGLLSGGSLAGPPPLSGQVQAPLVAPLDDTTFDPELPYGAVPAPQTAPDLAVGPAAGRGGVDLVDGERAAPAVAASLVLLLAAGHVLRWLRAGAPGRPGPL